MKILLVSWPVLPMSGGSSVIIENLVRNFSAEEMVVLGSSRLIQNNRIKARDNGVKFHYFRSELYFFGRGYRYFIWFRKWRFQPLIRKIKKIIVEEGITQVMGVYPNPFYCLAACRAAEEMQIPFSAYFHNTYADNLAIKDPQALKIQEEIFKRAKLIFVMSEGMQTFYKAKYGLSKFLPLLHTFNKKPGDGAMTSSSFVKKKTFHLVAIGNFNESNLEATRRFLDTIKDHPKYKLHLYTHVPALLLKRRGLDPKYYQHCGSVSHDQIHGILQKYDICLLTHGFTGGYGPIEYQTIFPTRTIPMLLSGKPIFAHSPKNSFLNQFLEKHKCALIVDSKSATDIISGLDKIADNPSLQRQLVEAANAASQQFYGPSVVADLKNALKKIE
ncbi:MAG: glycosyltransferase [Saprospiraceae bacterium]|nr:glycosyltransferase [Saprospiraceae bacterium]